MVTRRQILKLGASALALAGCRTLIDPLAALSSTTTPAISPLVPTLPVEATSARSAVQRPTVAPSPIEELRPAATPLAPRWIAPQAGSKLGLHVTFGPRDGLDDFLARCAEADKPVAVVKCVDDFEASFKAKQYSERTLTVVRVNGVGLNNRDFVDMQAWEPPELSPAIG